MSQVKRTYKSVAALFIFLTIILAASTAYFFTNPTTVTQTATQTQVQTVNTTVVTTVSSPLYSVNIAYRQGIGFYLTNATGWTLYFLKTDVPGNGTSTCTGNCIKFWPAFYTNSLNLPAGLNATKFSTITRPDGSKQLTYNGSPLYYFLNDKKPGDTNGQGVKGVWYGYSLPAPSELTTTTTTASGGGGMGGGY